MSMSFHWSGTRHKYSTLRLASVPTAQSQERYFGQQQGLVRVRAFVCVCVHSGTVNWMAPADLYLAFQYVCDINGKGSKRLS